MKVKNMQNYRTKNKYNKTQSKVNKHKIKKMKMAKNKNQRLAKLLTV